MGFAFPLGRWIPSSLGAWALPWARRSCSVASWRVSALLSGIGMSLGLVDLPSGLGLARGRRSSFGLGVGWCARLMFSGSEARVVAVFSRRQVVVAG